jgi:hypothetical protein
MDRMQRGALIGTNLAVASLCLSGAAMAVGREERSRDEAVAAVTKTAEMQKLVNDALVERATSGQAHSSSKDEAIAAKTGRGEELTLQETAWVTARQQIEQATNRLSSKQP